MSLQSSASADCDDRQVGERVGVHITALYYIYKMHVN